MANAPQTPQDAASQLQQQLMPSPLVPNSPQQDPQAAQQALLASLKDLHNPPPIGPWPVAPGWWLLAALAFSMVFSGLFYSWRKWRKSAYRRAGLRLLNRLSPDGVANQAFARQINEILKRTALASPFYKKEDGIAAAHGAHWAAFLCQSLGPYPDKTPVTQQLVHALYQRKASLDAPALLAFARYWVQHHQPLTHTAPLATEQRPSHAGI